MEHGRELLLKLTGFSNPSEEDQKRIAHAYRQTGSLPDLLNSRTDSLVRQEGLRSDCAQLLTHVPDLIRYCRITSLDPHLRIDHVDDLNDYLRALYVGIHHEQLYLFSLDQSRRLISYQLVEDGSLREMPVYLRRIASVISQTNAAFVILCHNHPGQTTDFSYADVTSTRRMIPLLRTLGVGLVDHMLYTDKEICSMRRASFIPEQEWLSTGVHNVSRAVWLDSTPGQNPPIETEKPTAPAR